MCIMFGQKSGEVDFFPIALLKFFQNIRILIYRYIFSPENDLNHPEFARSLFPWSYRVLRSIYLSDINVLLFDIDFIQKSNVSGIPFFQGGGLNKCTLLACFSFFFLFIYYFFFFGFWRCLHCLCFPPVVTWHRST